MFFTLYIKFHPFMMYLSTETYTFNFGMTPLTNFIFAWTKSRYKTGKLYYPNSLGRTIIFEIE